MRIGTDVSLDVCRAEGYLMMDYKKRELFVNGVFQKDCYVRFITHAPGYILEEMHGTSRPVGVKTISLDVELTAQDVWERYREYWKAIDSSTGCKNEFPTNEHELLNLACDVSSYSGLE
jgi:hypothetical protein